MLYIQIKTPPPTRHLPASTTIAVTVLGCSREDINRDRPFSVTEADLVISDEVKTEVQNAITTALRWSKHIVSPFVLFIKL
jgi:hypothetical protein